MPDPFSAPVPELRNPAEEPSLEKLLCTSLDLSASAPAAEKKEADPPAGLGSSAIRDIDSGRAFQDIVEKYVARINQLKLQLAAYEKKNDEVIEETVLKNLELILMNQNLEQKVKDRTQALEMVNARLVLNNQKLNDQTEQLKSLDEAKEALTHMIVHDMKNPLTAVLGTLKLFRKNQFNLPDNLHEMLLGADRHGTKLLGMIEQLLMISRMQSREFALKTRPTDLSQLIADCARMMEKTISGKTLKIAVHVPQAPLTLELDPEIIERVVNNLLNNAIKYAPTDTEIGVAAELQNQEACVSVTNWGEPIPKAHQQKVFDMFSRVREKDAQFSGTGLGLTFCKLAVEAHRGYFKVVSPVPPQEHGVCFAFYLPLASPSTA
ncbi:MAG: ATP-binding protein [candidate division FCPU426 bacterium]